MKRIILHWSGGTNEPNQVDYEHYHYLINSKGVVIKGKYTPEDNLNCNDGEYAQHTGGGNTGSIGVSMCGMHGFAWDYIKHEPRTMSKFPLTKVQCERCFKLCAELCKKYNLKITPDTVMTHYEFGKKHPTTSSNGKIDILYLPPYGVMLEQDVGKFIRTKIKWYYKLL